MAKLIIFSILAFFSMELHSKAVSDICYDKFEGNCMKKRDVDDIVPCLRVNFNALPKFCEDYRPLILKSLRRLDPVDNEEIRNCERIMVRGCFGTRSTKRIIKCMEENLRNFSPGCEEFKMKSSNNVPREYKNNMRIRRHVIKCSRNLSRKCGKVKNEYKAYQKCIRSDLEPECKELFVKESYKIKKVYNEFELANMEYKCAFEKTHLCPPNDENNSECEDKVIDRHSKECQDYYREIK